MPRLSLRTLLSTVLLGLAAPVSLAQIYRWVDAEGRVHFSDQAPAGVAAETIELNTDRAAPATRAPANPVAPAARPDSLPATRPAPVSAAARSPRAGAAAAGAGREQSCLAVRLQLVVLEIDRPVYRETDGRLGVFWASGTRPNYYEGERRYLEDDERNELLDEARTIVSRDCTDPDERTAQAAAEAVWFHDEDCRAMRAELASLQRPEMRTAESDLARKQREADAFCAAAPTR